MVIIYYSEKLQKAINFAIKVHQLDQNQTRKGKTVQYIMHPLSVGLILARTGADENIVIAGILHDTIEDCVPYGSVTQETIINHFGNTIARIVSDVSEQDKSLSWSERKQQAMDHIKDMQHDSVLVKSADVLHNLTDQLNDYLQEGDAMFNRFTATKEMQLKRYIKLVEALQKQWPDNPLLPELLHVLEQAKQAWI